MSAIIEKVKEVTEHMFTPKCCSCKHYLKHLSCEAFDIIPDNIVFNEIEHNKVIDGQKGEYVFETVSN